MQAQELLIAKGYLPALNANGESNADSKYGSLTKAAAQVFQTDNGLNPDGKIGRDTWPLLLGDAVLVVPPPDYPPVSPFPFMTAAHRTRVFGSFDYSPKVPATDKGEPIKIHGDWEAKNIEKFYIPQLDGVPFYPIHNTQKCSGWIRLHVKVGPIFQEFFDLVELRGHKSLIETFEGSYYPRFQRGSFKDLSNHSWGTAIDLNAYANGFRKEPAPMGEPGCLLPLVAIANECGIGWGGHWRNPRKDPMHFEVAVI